MRITLKQYCEENNRPELLLQWDEIKNLPLTPETVTRGSSRNVWWECDKGHSWQAAPYARTAVKSDCPVCAGKVILSGENDLKTMFPDIVEEWNHEKNSDSSPEYISPYSHKKVWWRCSTCGYEWEAVIKSRTGTTKSGCPVCANRVILPGTNDLETVNPKLAGEWHPTKNRPLMPTDVTSGSRRAVWWVCPEGHEWKAEISSRSRGNGCPVCSGKKVLAGFNDLESNYPDIAAEWHPTKNGISKPSEITSRSNKKYWWLCLKGHEYEASAASRTFYKTDCPYCTNRKVLPGFNDIAATHPHVATEWHPTKNSIKPTEVSAGSMKKVWWLCPEGHEYEAAVSSRVNQHTGCPVCANKRIIPEENSLAALYPQIASEWHPEKNGNLTPETVSAGSNRNVWWKCSCGHEWKAIVASRTSHNSGCPVCMNKQVLEGFNDLATTHPQIAEQWHPTLNGKFTPRMFTYGSTKNVWWICDEGHIWKAPISRRAGTQKSGCPVCRGRISKSKQIYYKKILAETKRIEAE